MAETGLTASQIAKQLGVSRQRVYQFAKKHGVKLTPAPRGAPPGRPTDRTRMRHGHDTRVSPTVTGAITEYTVAADLMKRGYYVYVAAARTGPFDLFAYSRERTLRVECKSINYTGQTCHINPADCDLVARVMPDGEILYTPDPGVVQMRRRFDQ